MGTSLSSGIAAAAALAAPWAVAPGLRDGIQGPKCVLVAAAAAAGACAWAARRAPSLAVGVELPLAALALAALASTLLSADRSLGLYGVDLAPVSSLYGLASVVSGLYLGAAASRCDARAPSRLAWALAAGSVPPSLLSVLQVVAPQPLPFLSANELGRAVGLFGHPVALGAYLALVAPAALALALGEPRPLRRAAAFAAAGLAVAGLAASGTRAGWAGAACGAGLVLWLDGRPALRRAAAAVAAAGVASAALAAILVGGVRLEGGRLGAWELAWHGFQESPLFGQGPGTFGLAYRRLLTPALASMAGRQYVFPHAHNDWIEVLFATGVAGLAAFAWLHFAAFKRAREAPVGAGAAAAFGGAAALLVFSKANLPTLPTAFLGALLVGAALGARPARGGRAAAAALFVAASVWAGWSAARRLPAERQAYLGRQARREGRPREAARHLEGAVRANPEVIAFRLDLMNLLWDSAAAAPPEDRRVLLARARDEALSAALRRPAEAEYLRLLGVAELRRARWAGEDSLAAARAAFEAARARDPLNPRLLRDLAALDDPAAERL